MPNHSQNLFLIGSSCFCLYMFGEFANVFEGPSDEYMQATHLNSAARSLSSPSRCFQLQILPKIYFVIFCAEMLQQFSPTPKGH